MTGEPAVDWTKGAPEAAETFAKFYSVNGLKLDFTPKSLHTVDALVIEAAQSGETDVPREFLLMAACYVGEVMARELGGTWVLAYPSDPLPSLKLTKNGGICNPVGKIIKLYRNGMADSVAFFFSGVKGVLEESGTKPRSKPRATQKVAARKSTRKKAASSKVKSSTRKKTAAKKDQRRKA